MSARRRLGPLSAAWPRPYGEQERTLGGLGASVFLRNEMLALQRRPVIVFAFVGSLGQLDLRLAHLLERNCLQDMGDAVEAGAPFVVRMHDMPGCVLAVRGRQHHVARLRVGVPALVGTDV